MTVCPGWKPISNRLRRSLNIVARWALVSVVVLLLLQSSTVLPEQWFRFRLSEQTAGLRFNFVAWEVRAWFAKLGMEFAAPQDTLTEAQRHQLVTDYVAGMRQARALSRQIDALYSEHDAPEAARQAASLEEELASLRSGLARRQGWFEGILEEQVSAELEEEGFGRWGYVWPPIKFRLTDLPLLLVISLRAQITREADVHLKASIPVGEQEALEGQIDRTFEDMSSLVTPIGGLSAYPAMVLEYDSLVWLTDTFAHEWTHDYLIFHPLGYNYSQSGEMTSVNETSASIVGREVGRQVILRYYAELGDELPPLPVPPEKPPMSAGELVWPYEPPADEFDFNREMRETRLRVDELLAGGQIDAAEEYMEQRRLFFVEHGHNIRKLNQAYFAFYGSYATSPSAANPIGGQLEWLRAQSPTLRDFVRTVSHFSRYKDLLGVLPGG
jgi:hypothetical protein